MGAINKLFSHKKVTPSWVPEHEGHRENKTMDELAKQSSSMPFIGSEPSCDIAMANVRQNIKEWVINQLYWKSDHRQTKQFIKRPLPIFKVEIISKNRKIVRVKGY